MAAMSTMRRRSLAALLALALLTASTPVLGAVASALLLEDGPLPGAPVGHAVSALSNTAVNHSGGYAVTVNSTDGTTTLSHVWGHATGGPGAIMRTEGTFGPLVQTSFESFFGISNAGNVAYSATGTGGPVGAFDSVWLDDLPLAVEGNPITTLPGQYWRFASRPAVAAGSQPYWVGGLTSVPGGTTENYALFYGAGGAVVLIGGQPVPDLPFSLGMSSSIGFDYRFSALGTHHLVPVVMNSGSTAHNDALVADGRGLLIDGSLVREQSPVPASAGGVGGERWFAFDFMGATEGGQWFFTGDTDAPIAIDEIIVKNGTIIHREGDVLDGQTLTGAIEGAYMNENADIAFVWDVVGTTALEALYVNNDLVLVEGDPVDLDGNGVVETYAKLVDFTGISALTMSDRDMSGTVHVYFTADVDTLGTSSTTDDVEGFFHLAVLVDDPTPVLASLVSVDARPDRVEVVWSLAAGTDADVYRAETGAGWTSLGTRVADGNGTIRFEDTGVVQGRSYGYRLRITTPQGEVTAGETYVTIPIGARFALRGARPNPSPGPTLDVLFSLTDERPAVLELLDLGGRCVASREVGSLGPGNHVVAFGREAAALPAGLYVVRLARGGSTLTCKAAIVR
jgi:hypothetical protein